MTAQSVTCQPQSPSLQRLVDGLLDRLQERHRQRPALDPQPEPHTRAGRRGIDPQPDRGPERVGLLAHELGGRARAGRALDADRRRLAETGVDAEVRGQRGLDDLLLHLAVQGDEYLLPRVVLAHVDQWVLLGELAQGGPQRPLVGGAGGHDHGFQAGRGELRARRGRPVRAEGVADADGGQTPQFPDLPGGDAGPGSGRAAPEDADRGDPPLLVTAEAQPVPGPYGAREHPGVSNLLPGRAPLDLEDHSRDRPVRVAPGGRQEFPQPAGQRADARAGDGRAAEHRVHAPAADRGGQAGPQPGRRRRPSRRPGTRPGTRRRGRPAPRPAGPRRPHRPRRRD